MHFVESASADNVFDNNGVIGVVSVDKFGLTVTNCGTTILSELLSRSRFRHFALRFLNQT